MSLIFPIKPLSAKSPRCFPLGMTKSLAREYGRHTTSLFQVRTRPTKPDSFFLGRGAGTPLEDAVTPLFCLAPVLVAPLLLDVV